MLGVSSPYGGFKFISLTLLYITIALQLIIKPVYAQEDTLFEGGIGDFAKVGYALKQTDFSLTTLCKQVDELARSKPLQSLSPDAIPYTECAASLWDVLNGTKNLQLWALKMIDASSKIQSGLLKGNLIDLGNFDECVEIDRTDFANSPYTGQHCLVQLLLSLPGLSNFTIDVNGAKIKWKDLMGGTTLKLTVSICAPSTCQPFMVEEAYHEIFLPVNLLLSKYNATLEAVIKDSDCHVKNRGPLAIEDWVVAAICVVIIGWAVVATLIHMYLIKERKPTPAENIVMSFSLKANATKLFSTRSSPDQMGAINGIKFFSIAWVVLGHRYRYLVQQPLINLLDMSDMFKDWTKMFLLNATLSVDTFFLISGLLNAYGFFTLLSKKRKYTVIDWIVTYVHRYIRLTPAYMIMIAITGTWLYRVNNGPIWDRLVGSAKNDCQENWWGNIIYLNNYLFPNAYCMMQSWYLAADMQMFWLAPFVLYPMWRWPIFGLIELLILTCLSVATPFAITYIYDISQPIPLSNDSKKVQKEMDMLYLPTHTKTIAYVVGIFAGYLLQRARTKKIKLPFNKITLIIGWLICAVFLLYALFGCYWLFQFDNPYTRVESSLYLAFYRLFWAIGVSWLVIACVMGHGGFVNSILSWRGFGPLGRLTYCVYLTHITVILYKMASIRIPDYLEDYNQVEQFIGDFFFSLVAATILSLTLESPILNLEKMIFGRGREPRKTEHTQPVDPGKKNDDRSEMRNVNNTNL